MKHNKWAPTAKQLGQINRLAETSGHKVFGLRDERRKHPVSWRGIH